MPDPYKIMDIKLKVVVPATKHRRAGEVRDIRYV
jgi:hypothetical protein